MTKIGLLINPIAGMGGRVGLKGTDAVLNRAIELGAKPIAQFRAIETLIILRRLLLSASENIKINWLTCSGCMGADALKASGFKDFSVVYSVSDQTYDYDTKNAVQIFLKNEVRFILFCGGDGTARDVSTYTKTRTPILGIPSGVKMYSGVFGTTPARTAEIVFEYLNGNLTLSEVDVLDLDEEEFRRGNWDVKLYTTAIIPYEITYVQSAKLLIESHTDAQAKAEIADYLAERVEAESDVLYLLGPGSTVKAIADCLNIDKTLLGIDALVKGKILARDLNEDQILDILDDYAECKLILSPIGAQGFVIGRGNLQISPEVIRKIGIENILVVATPEKLSKTALLRCDIGDQVLNEEFTKGGFIPVIIGYNRKRMVRAST